MNWYLARLVYRIICGAGNHKPQFDEQLRLVVSASGSEAFEKAVCIGRSEQESFYNQKNKLVQWRFINVTGIYLLSEWTDGAEIYSRINELDDAEAYIAYVNKQAELLQFDHSHSLADLTH